MEPSDVAIPARSRQQAMDWSLVLTSQGIAVLIDQSSDGGAWLLWVSGPDHDRAIEAIRLYERENRPNPWQRPLPWSGRLFHQGAFLWCLFLVVVFVWCSHGQPAVAGVGAMNNAAVMNGEWWRLWTAVALHKDLAHLLSNVGFGGLLLGLAMAECGAGWALLASLLAGAAGNAAALVAYDLDHRGLGASGMVMGSLGLLVGSSLHLRLHLPQPGFLVRRALVGGVLLLILIGTDPTTDVVAHVAGFSAGLFLGLIVNPRGAWLGPAPLRDRLCLCVFLAGVVVPWMFALRKVAGA